MSSVIGPIPGVRFSFSVFLIDEHGNGAEKSVRNLPYMPPIDPERIDICASMADLQLGEGLPEGSGQWRLMTDEEIADYLNGGFDTTYEPVR